jgi:hypothetical protein
LLQLASRHVIHPSWSAASRVPSTRERIFAKAVFSGSGKIISEGRKTAIRFQIDAWQTHWLKVAETLRRSDASVYLADRQAEVQIPLKTAENVVLYCAEWLRISLSTFLSAEGLTLAGGVKTVGEL